MIDTSQIFKRYFLILGCVIILFAEKIKEDAVLYCLVQEVKINDDTGKMHLRHNEVVANLSYSYCLYLYYLYYLYCLIRIVNINDDIGKIHRAAALLFI